MVLTVTLSENNSAKSTVTGQPKMRIFGYVRVSTREQAEGGESLAAQERTIRGYAMMRGWELGPVFVDAGISGSVPVADRPEGAKLMGIVAAGDVVVTPKLDRMFRNAADALVTLQTLKDDGVSLHMIDLGGDVTNNGVSKLVFTILSAVAEAERDRIRERIRNVKSHMAATGQYNGGRRPFGWDVVDGQLVPKTDEQAKLSTMRSMRDDGMTFREIAAAVGITHAITVKRILDRQSV
jgi:putative DNA-invertase from lambdoid prophage Rac